jgi:hypothetical protein
VDGFFATVIGSLVWLGSLFVASPESTLEGFRVRQAGTVGQALPILASIVILGFTAVLPITQREQTLRYNVERDLKNNRIKDALDVLASHRQNEFPPQWTPPPWPEYGEGDRNPSLTEIVKALETRSDVPEWVHSAYQEKLNRYRQYHPSYKP